jgi:hypothetical protein
VFQVEAPDVGAPEEIQIRRRSLRPAPPQPQDPRLPPTLAPGQTLDLHQDERANHDGQGSPSARPSWLWTFGCSSAHARTHP